MAELSPRSDRADPDRYQSLKEVANENDPDKTRSPGWTDRGDLPAQQRAANEYDKAAQQKVESNLEYNDSVTQKRIDAKVAERTENQPSGKELTDKARAYYEDRAQKLAPSQQQDRGQDRSNEMDRSRGMDFSR